MKKMLAFCMLFIGLLAHAEDKKPPYFDKATGRIVTERVMDGTERVYGDIVRLTDSTLSKVGRGIDKAVPVLKEGANNVWNILVKQQLVYALVWLFILIKSIVLLVIGCSFFKRPGWTDKPEGIQALQGAFVVAGLAGVVITSFMYQTIFMGLLNPKYGAIQELINFAGTVPK